MSTFKVLMDRANQSMSWDFRYKAERGLYTPLRFYTWRKDFVACLHLEGQLYAL